MERYMQNEMIGITEYGFIKLWSAIAYLNVDDLVIDRDLLETKLYQYKDIEEYSELFKNLDIRKDEEKMDLDHGFSLAKAIKDVKQDENDEDIFYIIMDMDKANDILTNHNTKKLVAMLDLYNHINNNQKTR